MDPNDIFDKNKICHIQKLLDDFWVLMKSFDEVKIVEKQIKKEEETNDKETIKNEICNTTQNSADINSSKVHFSDS